MRLVRTFALIAVVAVTAVGVTATAAHAQMEPAEVSQEQLTGNEHCNPCTVHIIGESAWTIELFGEVVTVCNIELDMEVNENGSGEFVNQALTGSNCGLQPCDDTHWPIETWEAGPDDFRLEYQFCVSSPLFGVVDCHLEGVFIDRDPVDSHLIEFTTDAEQCEETPDIHITNHATLEPGDQGTLEVDHM